MDGLTPQLLQAVRAYLECRRRRQPPRPEWVGAWEQFYRACAPLLHRFARDCRVPPADLNDCLQDVWADLVTALRHFHYNPRRGQFQSWLYTVVRNRARGLLRSRARHPMVSLSPEIGAALAGREASPAEEYERRCRQEAVRRALAALRRVLSACNYRLLHLSWVEGRTVREVAAALGLTPEQVRYRRHRLKQKARALLRPWAADDLRRAR
jgi:RNA polymerase sigma-70 factor (ECF subfamily)